MRPEAEAHPSHRKTKASMLCAGQAGKPTMVTFADNSRGNSESREVVGWKMKGRIEVMRFPVNIVKQIRTEYGNRCRDRSFIVSKNMFKTFQVNEESNISWDNYNPWKTSMTIENQPFWTMYLLSYHKNGDFPLPNGSFPGGVDRPQRPTWLNRGTETVVSWAAPSDDGGSPIIRYEVPQINGKHRNKNEKSSSKLYWFCCVIFGMRVMNCT